METKIKNFLTQLKHPELNIEFIKEKQINNIDLH
jgi:hypothetical protein